MNTNTPRDFPHTNSLPAEGTVVTKPSRVPKPPKSVAVASAERLLRAQQLVNEGSYLLADEWAYIYANTAGVPGYEIVRGGQCPCKDATVGYARRHGILCVHAEAERILRQQRGQRGPTDGPRGCFHCSGPLVESEDGMACPRCDSGARVGVAR